MGVLENGQRELDRPPGHSSFGPLPPAPVWSLYSSRHGDAGGAFRTAAYGIIVSDVAYWPVAPILGCSRFLPLLEANRAWIILILTCFARITHRQPQPPQGFLIGSLPVWAPLRSAYTFNVEEVAGLDPDLAALRTGLCLEGAAGREPQPGLRLEAFTALAEIAVQCQDLRTSR